MKIKELASEIGLTSKQLIDRCNAAGLPVQNSVTKLRPDQVLLVRSWFRRSAESSTLDEATRQSPD